MKRFLLALSIFVVSQNMAFSQGSIDPFKLDGVEWFEIEGVPNGSTGIYGTDAYCIFYKICGDTIQNDTTYKKVFSGSKFYYYGATGCPPGTCLKPTSPDSFSFYCFFRQDTLTKTNYFRQAGWTSDSLMVCYDLNVGDTIKRGYYANSFYMDVGQFPVVYQTDSAVVEGKKIKIYYTDTMGSNAPYYCSQWYNNMFLIEGLGSCKGLFYSYVPAFENYGINNVDSISYTANCNNNTMYVKGTWQKQELSIIPNPNNGIFTLETNSAVAQTVQLLDVTGRVVLTQTVIDKTQIDASKLPAGLYNLGVSDRNFVSNRRIIIFK